MYSAVVGFLGPARFICTDEKPVKGTCDVTETQPLQQLEDIAEAFRPQSSENYAELAVKANR